MLTKDLLRFSADDGKAVPRLLKPTPAIRELAERLLAHWNGGVGLTLGFLDDEAVPILHGTRSLLVAKGLQKLIVDACGFRDAASCGPLRERALAASAARLRAPLADPEGHRAAVAAELGLTGEALAAGLYADLPDAAVLETGCPGSADDLIARYNLAQCQGLLLTARELTVTIHDTDTGLRRRLLKALRFQRLLADIREQGTSLALAISGPGAVVDQANRYGLNLACFLPALACARRWEASAWVAPGRERTGLRLELSEALGLVGDTRFLGFVPAEVRTLAADLAQKRPEWRQEEPPILPCRSGELVVPDLFLRLAGRTVAVELFHRWHRHALERRLAQLAAGELPGLVLGVDRPVAKGLPGLAEHPVFAQRGFLFSDLPTARALAEAVARVSG